MLFNYSVRSIIVYLDKYNLYFYKFIKNLIG